MTFPDRFFRLSDHGTTVVTELRAGFVTFLTMSYILFVNPQLLSQAGLPAGDVALATALASALATLVMGLYARYPIALAPGMGLNAYFAFSVVIGMAIPYQQALAAVFVAGVLFLLLSIGGVRTALVNALPASLKVAITGGIGLFLALIGLQNAGVVVDSPATLVTLGPLRTPGVLLALAGLVIMTVLQARRIPGAILLGILAVTSTAWLTGLTPAPTDLLALPGLPRETFLALDFSAAWTGPFLTATLAFLFVDFFDTAGTLLGVGRLGGFLDDEGRLPRAGRAFTADALGTTAGALLGTSPVTSYIESATGIEEGGRTGLTAVVVAALFLLALFIAPVFTAIPAFATAPALIMVGALMMGSVPSVDWRRMDEAVPAFLTIVGMPFTYSIANGIALGLVSYVCIKLLTGRARTIPPLLYLLVALLVVYYGFIGGA